MVSWAGSEVARTTVEPQETRVGSSSPLPILRGLAEVVVLPILLFLSCRRSQSAAAHVLRGTFFRVWTSSRGSAMAPKDEPMKSPSKKDEKKDESKKDDKKKKGKPDEEDELSEEDQALQAQMTLLVERVVRGARGSRINRAAPRHRLGSLAPSLPCFVGRLFILALSQLHWPCRTPRTTPMSCVALFWCPPPSVLLLSHPPAHSHTRRAPCSSRASPRTAVGSRSQTAPHRARDDGD